MIIRRCPHCGSDNIHKGEKCVFDRFTLHFCLFCGWVWAFCWGEWIMAKSFPELEEMGGTIIPDPQQALMELK